MSKDIFVLLIGVLLVLLILAGIYLCWQRRKLCAIRKELHVIHHKLSIVRAELMDVNQELIREKALLEETNRTKKVYITHFLALCSAYVNKLNDYRELQNKEVGKK